MSISSGCTQRILETKAALCGALRKHHGFFPNQTEILRLTDELDALKEIVPSTTAVHLPSSDGDGIQPSPALHAEVVSTLCEAIDMHNNCDYLLAVHRSIEMLSSSVRQLCQCVRQPRIWEPDTVDQEVRVDVDFSASIGFKRTCVSVPHQQGPCSFPFQLDEDSYKLCTNAVVSSLAKVESLMNQRTKFDKDSATVFHAFRRTLHACKARLSEHVDFLWRHWVVWHTRTRELSEIHQPNNLSRLLFDLRLIDDLSLGSTVPSTSEIVELLEHPGDKWIPADLGCLRQPTLLASLTVYAKPGMLTELFRLMSALSDLDGRFHEFTWRLWKYLFEPWLEKLQYASGSSKSQTGWPILRSAYLDLGTIINNDSGKYDENSPWHLSHLLPAWRLELVSPECTDENDSELILSSCSQVASAFQGLFTNVLSLRPLSDSPSVFMHHTDAFDGVLALRLIEGRFSSVLPSAKQCRTTAFLAPVTQAVYSLAMTGKETGFLSGELDENSSVDNFCGGVAILLHWIHILPQLAEIRRTNEILAKVRSLFADTSLFRVPVLSGTKLCPKPDFAMRMLPFADSDGLLDEELCVFEQQAAEMRDSPTNLLPSFSRLLQSECNLEDLTRYLNLNHFHFPLCKISKVVPALMEVIEEVIAETQTFLDRLSTDRDTSAHDTTCRSAAVKLLLGIIELVPRLIMSYTSVVPALHHELEKDLHSAALHANSCNFLAHECLTLGEARLIPLLKKLPFDEQCNEHQALKRLASANTCVLVSHLRTAGLELLLRNLRRYKERIEEEMKKLHGIHDLSVLSCRQCFVEAVQACFGLLRSLCCDLRPLSLSMYYHCIGFFCDLFCAELITTVLRLSDLTTEDCEVLTDVLQEVETEIVEYFSNFPDPELREDSTDSPLYEVINNRVPQLCRIRGVISILTSCTLTDLKERLWNRGEGPLSVSAHLRSSEVRSIVEAIYSHSSIRDDFLRQLL